MLRDCTGTKFTINTNQRATLRIIFAVLYILKRQYYSSIRDSSCSNRDVIQFYASIHNSAWWKIRNKTSVLKLFCPDNIERNAFRTGTV